MGRIFITGDTHADFGKLWRLHRDHHTTYEDIVIILGDSGINYMSGNIARITKENITRLPLTVFCIHGNHEQRPENIPTYTQEEWMGGTVYRESAYANLIFAKDGEIYYINGHDFFVIGGAYSPDKQYRIQHKYPWFEDEQPSELIKKCAEEKLAKIGFKVEYVLTHTCPYSCIPFDVIGKNELYGEIDYSTEQWLQKIESKTEYEHWLCGHYHIDYNYQKVRFLFNDIVLVD